MNQVKLKYLCSSYSTPITQEQIQEEGEFRVYGAGGLTGYLPVAGCKSDYLGIIKDGAGVGRINAYEAGSYLLGTMAYIVPNSEIDINWLKYAVMSLNLSESISKTTIPHIYFSEYGNRKVGWCSTEMQRRIADFLDRKCAEIDSVMANTRRTIEEYKKLKQSIITEAVTKGVRGKRPMKDSGNIWLGWIPTEVMVSRIGLHFDIILGKMVCSEKKSNDMEEYPYICAANVHFSGVDSSSLKKMWFTSEEIKQYTVREGDLLVVEGGAGAGGCAIVSKLAEMTGIQNSIQIVRPKSSQDVRFLAYFLQSIVKRAYIDVVCNKATIPHFTKDKLACVPYPIWDIDEQSEISDYLDKKCTAIDNIVSIKEHLLTELESYKKSVIYEYVTGKKEVPVCR